MHRAFGLVAALATTIACGSEVIPPNLGGTPEFFEIDVSGAQDLGHVAEVIAAEPGAITLVDVTDAAGLSGALGGGNQHGVGIAFVDVDGDDFADIFVANGRSNQTGNQTASQLFINNQDGTFRDATASSGVGVIADRDCFSVAAADFDGDGDVDLYVGAQPNDILLENTGSGSFIDATQARNAGGPASNPADVSDGRSKVVAFGDFDGDGWLDIASSSSTLPSPFAYLLRNDGAGNFVDITSSSEIFANTRGNPCAIMWTDYDNDRDQDLWIWNDRGGHVLLQNDAGQRFNDATASSGVDRVNITHPMGIDGGDFDLDGDLDYYISNIGNNPLLRNNGDGTFTDITRDAGTGGDYGWGLAFEDFDLDGYLDIFVAQEDNRPHLILHNLGEVPPAFERIEIDHPNVISSGAAHNVAAGFADFDHDGRTDVVVAGTDGSRITLYRNETNVDAAPWLQVVVRGTGGASQRGIGSRVLVKTGDVVQFRDGTAGSSRASQNEHPVRFGLGDWSGAEWIAVQHPTGARTVLTGVEGNQRLVVDLP